jgi:hypothetical protein
MGCLATHERIRTIGRVVSDSAGSVAMRWTASRPSSASTTSSATCCRAGHLVQSIANTWEGWLWKTRGRPSSNRMSVASKDSGRPSSNRMSVASKDSGHQPYDAALQTLIKQRIEGITGTKELSTDDMFAVARTELRTRQLEGQAELMNALYGLCRGLTTACALLIPILVIAGVHTQDWTRLGIALGVVAAATLLYGRRATRYSYRFADQVWRDFAALKPQ